MQRAYDQVIHDIGLQKLPVVLCMDRAGIAGADGPTHHGAYDIAYMRCIPHLVVAAPMNEQELRNLMLTASEYHGPFSIRYPRGTGVMPNWKTPMEVIEIGKGRKVLEGEDVAILTFGTVGNYAVSAAEELRKENLNPAVYDMRFVKPLDQEMLHEVFSKFKNVITVEDGCLMGGFGSAVLEFAGDHGYTSLVKRLGIPDEIIEHGDQNQLHKDCGYDTEAIKNAVFELVAREEKLSVL